jgi:hypothetical protein
MNEPGARRGRTARGAAKTARAFAFPAAAAAIAVIAVLLVLKFVFHIQFGFFATKLSLRPTALTLEEIQDLEFLVTAEYFGEVIGTARDYFDRTAVPEAESILTRLLESPKPEEVALSAEDTAILDAVRGALIRKSRMNPRVIDLVGDIPGTVALARPEFAGRRFGGEFREALVGFLLERRDIAYLARGVVQAGYDLAAVDESRYLYCPAERAVYLQMEPEILSKAINPWFIYDPAANVMVKGFEIIAESNVDLEDDDAFAFVNGVKAACRERLLEDALKAGLKDQARASAEQTLANLFKIFRSDVEAVKFLGPEEFRRQKMTCSGGRAAESGN